ncbi:DNA-binding NarL/FixJ family response regulator [Virgibacillus natechei]|uniref:DNA-binding NarL/FixJ family response regulator n=1 Tax=Virgibacillus natechei TaxID=1216297 RepID=A0ABS4ICK8_9BACI|nr:hypothetical protein [Virgibacillus natechei]MBP1968076.1 DNA-binding NarL/FixJ family response regulator [Virgibacillus natechei]UZD14643.1 hypothetical protein OLD84_09160 [Virgibacillus natechei]
MVSFVLIISFLLHIITLVVIYQFFKQIQTLKQTDSNDNDDIVELFEVYLQEFKDENKRLQDELLKDMSARNTDIDNIDMELETTAENKSHHEHTPPEYEAVDRVEASLQARILQLYHKGLSETEIAQKLDCGKTEVALIIKLHA